MQVEIRIDGAYPEPKVVILTATVTEEVNQLVKKLSGDAPCILSGMKDGKIEVLEPAELIRVYAGAGKVYAVTEKGEYVLRLRLYEAEQEKRSSEFTAERRSQVGSGMRNERIRTYNFPQGRVTDHRIGLTLYKIESVMDGDLDELMDALAAADQAERLKQTQ